MQLAKLASRTKLANLVPRQATFAPLPPLIMAATKVLFHTATGRRFLEAALAPRPLRPTTLAMEKSARVRPRHLSPIKVTIIESDKCSWLRIGLYLGFTALFTDIALLMLPDRSAVLAPGILNVTVTTPASYKRGTAGWSENGLDLSALLPDVTVDHELEV